MKIRKSTSKARSGTSTYTYNAASLSRPGGPPTWHPGGKHTLSFFSFLATGLPAAKVVPHNTGRLRPSVGSSNPRAQGPAPPDHMVAVVVHNQPRQRMQHQPGHRVPTTPPSAPHTYGSSLQLLPLWGPCCLQAHAASHRSYHLPTHCLSQGLPSQPRDPLPAGRTSLAFSPLLLPAPPPRNHSSFLLSPLTRLLSPSTLLLLLLLLSPSTLLLLLLSTRRR